MNCTTDFHISPNYGRKTPLVQDLALKYSVLWQEKAERPPSLSDSGTLKSPFTPQVAIFDVRLNGYPRPFRVLHCEIKSVFVGLAGTFFRARADLNRCLNEGFQSH